MPNYLNVCLLFNSKAIYMKTHEVKPRYFKSNCAGNIHIYRKVRFYNE